MLIGFLQTEHLLAPFWCSVLQLYCHRMVCQKIFSYLRKLPWIAKHVGCFVAFLVQMSILANNKISPMETVSHFEEKTMVRLTFLCCSKFASNHPLFLKSWKKLDMRVIGNILMGRAVIMRLYMDGQVIKKMEMSQEVIKVGIA